MHAQCFDGSVLMSLLRPWSLSLFVDAFSLDPNTGLVRSRRLLQSSERFNLTVVATDQGRPPLWGTADLIITVIDVNDNRPVFVRPANGTIIHILEVACQIQAVVTYLSLITVFLVVPTVPSESTIADLVLLIVHKLYIFTNRRAMTMKLYFMLISHLASHTHVIRAFRIPTHRSFNE